MKLPRHFSLGGKKYIAIQTNGSVADRLGQMALAGSTGTGNEQRDFFFHELAGGQIHDHFLVNERIECKVKGLQGLSLPKPGPPQSQIKFSG